MRPSLKRTALAGVLLAAVSTLTPRAPCFAQAQTCAYVLRRAEEGEPSSGALLVLAAPDDVQTSSIALDDLGIPQHVALAPDGRRAYVTSRSSGDSDALSIIDTATNSVIDTVHGDFGCGVAVSPDNRFVFAGSENGNLAIIGAETHEIVEQIPEAGGCDVQVSQNGLAAFALRDGAVTVVDTVERRVLRSISVRLSTPSAIATGLSLPAGGLLYAGEDLGFVDVIEIPNNAVATTIASACDRTRGLLTDVVATRDGRLIYATHRYDAGDGCIAIISATSQRSLLSIPVEAGATAVGTSPDNSRAYVGTGGSEEIALYLVDVRTSTLVDTLPLGGCAPGVTHCYVQDIAVGTVPGGCSGPPTPTVPTSTPTSTPTRTPSPTPGACFGDCDGDGRVAVDELVYDVGIALGIRSAQPCPSADGDEDGAVRIDDLVRAVNAALVGCVGSVGGTAAR